MVVRGVTLYLLLGYLIKGATSTCAYKVCLRCNTTATGADPCELCNATQCISGDIQSNCTTGFQVSINSNGSKLVEGEDLILTCLHNLPDVNHTFGWKMDGVTIQGQNKSELYDEKVLSNKEGTYICYVENLCGYYQSLPHVVTVENNSLLLLVVCGVSALVLVLFMGLVMKFKLKRDNAKHRERMRQKAAAEQRDAPSTPRES
ncbi:uncharacterized protein [Notothenia coriiceps]|uniref:Ig-like domain-containing protein n=1 Tax=Notothenia coriiceps TaxID=8208 RepID=A0A6I9N7J2_9TELE|nr:PREDICTED: uncharacterized protein LOC104947124 [Notothenia coriiceps]